MRGDTELDCEQLSQLNLARGRPAGITNDVGSIASNEVVIAVRPSQDLYLAKVTLGDVAVGGWWEWGDVSLTSEWR